VQNPSPRSLAVAFSLPGSTPAALELFDVAGRRVLRHDVGGLGAGRHVVPLGAGRRLAAGLYLIRLVRGNEALSARVVVLD
jgi:hypothetical protein